MYFMYIYISGYIGCKSFLLKVADLIKDLKKVNPNLIYGKFLCLDSSELV